MGVYGCGHPISMSVLRTVISASAADAITVFIIGAIVNIGPLSFGFGSFYERNMCAPALLLALDSFKNPASACAANIISLFLNSMPSLGYVAK